MLNLPTANEKPLMSDQSENAIWMYTGIATDILIGVGGIVYLFPKLWLIIFVKIPIAKLKATKRHITRFHF